MTRPASTDDDTGLRVRVPGAWKYLEGIRRFCGFYARATWGDDELAQRVEVVVHELCENAVRQSEDAALEIGIDGTDAVFEVSVTNPVEDPVAQSVRRVAEELHPIDPEEAFRAAMQAAGRDSEAETRLGLARLRYEARVVVAARSLPARLTVTARGKR